MAHHSSFDMPSPKTEDPDIPCFTRAVYAASFTGMLGALATSYSLAWHANPDVRDRPPPKPITSLAWHLARRSIGAAAMGVLFVTVQCVMEHSRKKRDHWNVAVPSFVTGSYLCAVYHRKPNLRNIIGFGLATAVPLAVYDIYGGTRRVSSETPWRRHVRERMRARQLREIELEREAVRTGDPILLELAKKNQVTPIMRSVPFYKTEVER